MNLNRRASNTSCLIDINPHQVNSFKQQLNINTLVLTDFSKAFDHIDHEMAETKLLKVNVNRYLVK